MGKKKKKKKKQSHKGNRSRVKTSVPLSTKHGKVSKPEGKAGNDVVLDLKLVPDQLSLRWQHHCHWPWRLILLIWDLSVESVFYTDWFSAWPTRVPCGIKQHGQKWTQHFNSTCSKNPCVSLSLCLSLSFSFLQFIGLCEMKSLLWIFTTLNLAPLKTKRSIFFLCTLTAPDSVFHFIKGWVSTEWIYKGKLVTNKKKNN